jgi:hypothetical protein
MWALSADEAWILILHDLAYENDWHCPLLPPTQVYSTLEYYY